MSIDYLLDNGEHLDLSVIREEINLDEFTYERKLIGRWNKKAGKKDMVVRGKYPNAEIHYLTGKQYFVIVFDEFIESRQLSEKITACKFEIGNFSFVDCGVISEADTKS